MSSKTFETFSGLIDAIFFMFQLTNAFTFNFKGIVLGTEKLLLIIFWNLFNIFDMFNSIIFFVGRNVNI